MTANLIVDLVLIALLPLLFISGWRQGAITAVFSAVGLCAGLVIGLAISPLLVGLGETQGLRLVLLFAVIVFFSGVGYTVGGLIGVSLRDRAKSRSTLRVDSVVGAAFQTVACVFVIWFVSVPLAVSLPGVAGEALRESRVLAAIDRAVPAGADTLPARFAALLDDSGLPPLVSPFHPPGDAAVDAPNPAAIDPAMVERVRPSIVHVMGDAEVCSRLLMGSGFVTAPDYVITNAHVVAGTEEVELDTVLGVKEAEVVHYDPAADLAVLHAPGLNLEPLPFAAEQLRPGGDAVVMGFPQSGPFTASAARVRQMLTISGPDIYATGRVDREAYTLRGEIVQGNSGGPVLTPAGEVAGVIFGASVQSSGTGYALTAREVRNRLGGATNKTVPADTRQCVAR
ncbi:MarP family serine protease [Corynebacterium mayonis]|uniref:MarP family serine protease n=1 Tax=Corynebacterium mayonis TaxID=3062461 RepID=UPI003140A289